MEVEQWSFLEKGVGIGNSSLYETYFYTVLIFFQWTVACLIKEIKHQEILYYEERDMVLGKIPYPLWVLVFSFTK